jgi:hypothetical protein
MIRIQEWSGSHTLLLLSCVASFSVCITACLMHPGEAKKKTPAKPKKAAAKPKQPAGNTNGWGALQNISTMLLLFSTVEQLVPSLLLCTC